MRNTTHSGALHLNSKQTTSGPKSRHRPIINNDKAYALDFALWTVGRSTCEMGKARILDTSHLRKNSLHQPHLARWQQD